jgi:hypothetical protein
VLSESPILLAASGLVQPSRQNEYYLDVLACKLCSLDQKPDWFLLLASCSLVVELDLAPSSLIRSGVDSRRAQGWMRHRKGYAALSQG